MDNRKASSARLTDDFLQDYTQRRWPCGREAGRRRRRAITGQNVPEREGDGCFRLQYDLLEQALPAEDASYRGEPPYPGSGAEEPGPVAVLLVAAEEDDLLVDPHDLPGGVLVEVDEQVEAFPLGMS